MSGSTTEDVVGGRKDSGMDAGVVALRLGGEGLCSGALVAPDVVLTARHCVSYTSESVACPAHQAQVNGNREPSSIAIYAGDDVKSGREIARGASVVVPSSDVLCDHDIALIRLDRTVREVAPVPVDLATRPTVGTSVRVVGFGLRGSQSQAGAKYARAHVRVTAASSSEFEVGEAVCSGDSGGPAIGEASGAILGVVSRGRQPCTGPDAGNIYTEVRAFARLFAEAGVGVVSAGGTSQEPAKACGSGTRCSKGFHCNATKHVCEPAS